MVSAWPFSTTVALDKSYKCMSMSVSVFLYLFVCLRVCTSVCEMVIMCVCACKCACVLMYSILEKNAPLIRVRALMQP